MASHYIEARNAEVTVCVESHEVDRRLYGADYFTTVEVRRNSTGRLMAYAASGEAPMKALERYKDIYNVEKRQ